MKHIINDLLELIPKEENIEDDGFDVDESFDLMEEIDNNIDREEINEELLEYLDSDVDNFDKKVERKELREESFDEGIFIDDETKNVLRDEFFDENFDEEILNKDNRETKLVKSRKKIYKPTLNLEELFNAIFVPLAAVTVPFGIFVIYGGNVLLNNLIKILVYEIGLFAVFTFSSLISSRVQK